MFMIESVRPTVRAKKKAARAATPLRNAPMSGIQFKS